MSENRIMFAEIAIANAVKKLLCEDANRLLEALDFRIPYFEFGDYSGNDVVNPDITILSCERSEKERIVLVNAYAVEIAVPVADCGHDGELFAYAYGAAISGAARLNGTLDGIVDRIAVTECRYAPPKRRNCGDCWIVAIKLRVTVEGHIYDSKWP